jgi:hypothetical protein
MRRFLTGLGLATAAAVVLGRFRRRKQAPPAADPAEELKQKLAETRTDEAPPDAEPEPEEQEAPLDERRRAVHDRARTAMDDMLGGEQLPGEESE